MIDLARAGPITLARRTMLNISLATSGVDTCSASRFALSSVRVPMISTLDRDSPSVATVEFSASRKFDCKARDS